VCILMSAKYSHCHIPGNRDIRITTSGGLILNIETI
jgi:hypothetical protein